MKVIDLANPANQKGLGQLRANLGGVLDRGIGWLNDQQGQEAAIPLLNKALSDANILLRNAILSHDGKTVSLILVTRASLYVFYPYHKKGIVKIKGKLWGELDEEVRQYRASTENPMKTAVGMARLVLNYFDGHAQNHPRIEPIVLCTNPGTHVDIDEAPPVRVFMRDGITRLAKQIVAEDELVTTEEVIRLAEFISEQMPLPEPASAPVEDQDEGISFAQAMPQRYDDAPASFLEVESQPPSDAPASWRTPVTWRERFSPTQWAVIGLVGLVGLMFLCLISIIFLLN